MPRIPRLVIPGVPHHITHRGNNRERVFNNDSDHRAYLELLQKYAPEHGLAIMGYCLMPNHIHLVAIPNDQDSLAKVLGRAHARYAQLFNWRHNRCGHLWQGRYFSCALDEAHLVAAMRYVERNPARAGMVELPWDYHWSSAISHLGQRDLFGLLELEKWSKEWPPEVWREMLLQSEEEKQLAALRQCTRTSRPLGSESFISELEALLGRRIRPLPTGRPRRPRYKRSLQKCAQK